MASQRRGRRRLPPVQTGLAGRCPECGEGRLFKTMLGIVNICAVCGADFTNEDLGDGPAVFVIFIVSIFILPLVLGLHVFLNPPFIVTFIFGGAIIITSCLWLLRLLRGVMFNIAWQRKAREIRVQDFEQ